MQGALALRPLETRADAPVLVGTRDRHHVRITRNLMSAVADRYHVMHEPDHLCTDERAERPPASLARNNQMPTRRDLQIRQPECLPLQTYTRIKLRNRPALAHLYLFLLAAHHLKFRFQSEEEEVMSDE
jgi:hypothetical protein